MMKILNTVAEVRTWRHLNQRTPDSSRISIPIKADDSLSSMAGDMHTSKDDDSVGFVPTMGALHQGHLELIHQSREENAATLLSIFVNPTQFNNPEDLAKYPRNIEMDLKMAEAAGVSAVFLPTEAEMYPIPASCWVEETEFSKKLCGAYRPGHFRGVLSVVMKLFQIVQPTRAYFGEKDFQQLTLIKKMVQEFFVPVEIRAVPTLREKNGLALSSRNQRLSDQGRQLASHISKALFSSANLFEARRHIEAFGIEIEYLEEEGNRWFFAGYIEGVRLIDNVSAERSVTAQTSNSEFLKSRVGKTLKPGGQLDTRS